MDSTNNSRSVMLVDDDKFLLDMYTTKFTQRGYSVQACISADDALKFLREGLEPNAILFDLTMPERDGLSFLQEIKDSKLASNALKIALTNQSSEEEKAKVIALGTDSYIVKATMIPSEVVNTVDQLLSGAN
ncbi:MAG: response regulator [Patescibacteria group bacterium]|nr:response regulator [Patescibacteria group bacterium]